MRKRPLSIALIVAIALTGCTKPAPVKPSSAHQNTPTSTPLPSAMGHGHDWDAEPVAPPASAGDEAAQVAAKAMEMFARPAVPAATWRAELGPYLTDQARLYFQTADPSPIPATRITGAAQLAPSDLVQFASVIVPTDAGNYTVSLFRPTTAAGWLVSMITDPSGRS